MTATHPCQYWGWGWCGGERSSYHELHHPNNIILFMVLVDRSPVWLAWGSAQVNWKPELCNGTGSWADTVPLVITQEACVSVYRLHLRFTAPVWEWNIRGQVMDVAVNGTEGVEMGNLYWKKNSIMKRLTRWHCNRFFDQHPLCAPYKGPHMFLFKTRKYSKLHEEWNRFDLSMKMFELVWYVAGVFAFTSELRGHRNTLSDSQLLTLLLIRGP